MNIKAFKAAYGRTTDKKLAEDFNLTVEEVEALAEKHALGKDKRVIRTGGMPRWTVEEISTLRSLHPDRSNEEIAVIMGKTVKGVISKAHGLRLKKSAQYKEEMGRKNISKRFD